jgi:hypothetical protein
METAKHITTECPGKFLKKKLVFRKYADNCQVKDFVVVLVILTI